MIKMNYTLYCANCRDYTLHSVLDDKDGKIQTIKCFNCGYEQQHVILSRQVSVPKALYDQHPEYQKNAK